MHHRSQGAKMMDKMRDTPIKELVNLRQSAPSALKKAADNSTQRFVTGMGARKPSWSVRKVSNLKDSQKGERDEMPKDRREKLQAILFGPEHDHSHLSRSETFLDTLKRKEAAERIKSDDPVEVLFSSPLAPMINRNGKRAICVTRKAVHLLEKLDNSNITNARHGNHTVLHTFTLSNLVSIIESKKDPKSVCLDFRPYSHQDDKRKPLISSLPDATYILFPFPETSGSDKAKSLSRKDEFVAVLYFRFSPPFSDDKPKGCLVVTDLPSLRTADDAQRAISQTLRKEALNKNGPAAMVELMDAGGGDKQQVAQNNAVVELLKNEGDKRILVSLLVSILGKSGSVKSDVLLVLTDCAIYYNEAQQPEKLIRRVELQDIDRIVLEDNSKRDLNNKQWDVLLHIDLANDKSKDFPTDMLFRCEKKHQRELLVRSIQSAYQDLVMVPMSVLLGANIKKDKKGKLDAWLQTLRGGGRRKQAIDKRTEESLKWLIYLVQHKMYDFLSALADVIPPDDLQIMGKSLVSLCGSADLTEKLLREVVNVEMDSSTDTTTIFRGSTLSTAVLRAYIGESVDDYLKLVLSRPLQQFMTRNPNIEVRRDFVDEREARLNAPSLWLWCDRFFDSITNANTVESMPHEMRKVVGIISEACKKRSLDSNPYIGGYVMLRVFSPALTTPHTHKLTHEEPDHRTVAKLMLVAKVLQHVSNKTFVSQATDPTFYAHVNWWLRKQCGSDSYDQPRTYKFHGTDEAQHERTTWKVYINMLVNNQLTLHAEEEDEEFQDVAEIEAKIRDPGFAEGYDTRTLGAAAGLHNLLTKYAEQLLCLLWAETGMKKYALDELEAKLEQMEQERIMESESSPHSGQTQYGSGKFLSPPAAFGSPLSTRGFNPRSPLHRGKREDFYQRRSSMPIQAEASSAEQSPMAKMASPMNRDPRKPALKSAFTEQSPPDEVATIPFVGSSKEVMREKQEYVEYLRGLLSSREMEVSTLVCERDRLRELVGTAS